MYLLDTNTLIYFFKNQGNVAAQLLTTAPEQVAISTITLFEIETGLAKSTDPAKRRAQLGGLLEVIQLLPFDQTAARQAASIRAELEKKGLPIGPHDTLIAATALAHSAILVTHNVREFARVPDLKVIDWYA